MFHKTINYTTIVVERNGLFIGEIIEAPVYASGKTPEEVRGKLAAGLEDYLKSLEK